MPLPTPEQVWHERLTRALEREGLSRARVEWAHDLLVVAAHRPEFMRWSDDGAPRVVARWPNQAAGDDEATERATRELMDRMGEHVGIGPCPRGQIGASRHSV
jgi:hypothetical protein